MLLCRNLIMKRITKLTSGHTAICWKTLLCTVMTLKASTSPHVTDLRLCSVSYGYAHIHWYNLLLHWRETLNLSEQFTKHIMCFLSDNITYTIMLDFKFNISHISVTQHIKGQENRCSGHAEWNCGGSTFPLGRLQRTGRYAYHLLSDRRILWVFWGKADHWRRLLAWWFSNGHIPYGPKSCCKVSLQFELHFNLTSNIFVFILTWLFSVSSQL